MLGHRIIVAVTGASGAVYARLLLEQLCASPEVERIGLIVSRSGEQVAAFEAQAMPEHGKIVRYGVDDLFASPASGSARWDAMAVVPCSMGTAGRIASGVSADLIGRAADVMLKERRRLILMTRETPLSTIHLRNLTTLSECGAVVLPASPSFYSGAADIEALCLTVVERAMALLGIEGERFEWGESGRLPG